MDEHGLAIVFAMKWLGYAFTVVIGLVTLGIAVGVISMFDSRFERVVVDLLVLIYIAIRSEAQARAFSLLEIEKRNRNRFVELMKAVGDKQFDSDAYRKSVREEDERIDHHNIGGYIHGLFLFVIFVFAVWNLLTA